MEEINSLKPNSIFDIADKSIFFEEEDYIESGNHYEYFYAISKYYNPDSILEIGIRHGYSLYALMLGSTTLSKVVGYDCEEDFVISTQKNLSPFISDGVDFIVENNNTQELNEISDSYFLIHIDGDASYEGRYHDLELTKGKARVVLVSDFFSERSGRDAAQRFVYDNRHIIKNTHVIESLRGLYIIEYVG